jgi:PTH1 family peptidyl-tRNA hydrolase
VVKLVVGLGNPGPQYEGTRHNVGFQVLDRLAVHEGLLFHPARRSDPGLAGYGGPTTFSFARSFDPDALLLKPESYMNRSGELVAPVAAWLAVEPEDVLVVYDDMDLPLGSLRIRPNGGAGGHNGMRSIIDCLGTDRFPRLRVGIGRPGTDAARHVLSGFDPKEREDIEISVAEAAEAVLDWLLSGDLPAVMTRYHSRWNAQ